MQKSIIYSSEKHKLILLLTLIRSGIIEKVKNWNKNVKNVTAFQNVEHEFLSKTQKIKNFPFSFCISKKHIHRIHHVCSLLEMIRKPSFITGMSFDQKESSQMSILIIKLIVPFIIKWGLSKTQKNSEVTAHETIV